VSELKSELKSFSVGIDDLKPDEYWRLVQKGKIILDKNGKVSLDQIPYEALDYSYLSGLTPEMSNTLRHISWLELFDPSQTLNNIKKKILDMTTPLKSNGISSPVDVIINDDTISLSDILDVDEDLQQKFKSMINV